MVILFIAQNRSLEYNNNMQKSSAIREYTANDIKFIIVSIIFFKILQLNENMENFRTIR